MFTDGTEKLKKVMTYLDSTDKFREVLTLFTDSTEKLREVQTSTDPIVLTPTE